MKLLVNDERKDEFLLFIEFCLLIETHFLDSRAVQRKKNIFNFCVYKIRTDELHLNVFLLYLNQFMPSS